MLAACKRLLGSVALRHHGEANRADPLPTAILQRRNVAAGAVAVPTAKWDCRFRVPVAVV